MDEEQIQQLFEELKKQTELAAAQEKLLGQVSKKTTSDLETLRKVIAGSGVDLAKLAKASEDAAKAESKLAAEQEEYAKSIKQAKRDIGAGTYGLAKSLAAGETGFSQFGGVIKNVTGLLGKMAGSIPVAGQYIEKGMQAAGEAASFLLQQVDQITKSYNELGKVGGITATGVDGLRLQFEKMGLVSLPAFAEAVNKNAQGLAALGPTTARGAKKLGDALGQLTAEDGPFIGSLLKMGYTVDEITAVGSRYVSIQTLMGNRQIKSTEDLTKAMSSYLEEIDRTARATGRTREQVLEEQQKNLADVKFRARLAEMRDRGMDGAADQLDKLVTDIGGPMADAIRASVAGVPLTKEAQGAVALMGNAIQRSISNIEKGSTAEKERYKIMQAGADGVKRFNKNIQVGAAELLGGEGVVRQALDFQQALREGRDPFQIAKADQDELKAQQGQTAAMTDAQKAIANAARGIQRLGFDGLPAATTAAKTFAITLDTATNAMRKILGLGPLAPTQTGVTPPAQMGNLANKIIGAEGGSVTARNPYSSASGLGQITRGRYQDLVKGSKIGSKLYGTTFEQYQQSADLQQEALNVQIANLQDYLQRQRLPATDAAVYMAHVFGPAGARQILTHGDSVEVSQLLDPGVISKNPAIFGKSGEIRTVGQLKKVISDKMGTGYEFGGIATGPRSGYAALLHGNEAVVPLPDGRTIPVTMPDLSNNMREQISVMSMQISKLDELVSLMRNQNNISTRILQHSQA